MLHGRLNQHERSNIFDEFMESKFSVLFSTNVAARGLGIPPFFFFFFFFEFEFR